MERQAINFVVQASACDLMKVAMERINQTIDQMFPFDLESNNYFRGNTILAFAVLVRPTPIRPVYFVLQVHDELIFEVEKSSRKNEIIHAIRDAMERNSQLNLSLPVHVKSGDNWESMKSVI